MATSRGKTRSRPFLKLLAAPGSTVGAEQGLSRGSPPRRQHRSGTWVPPAAWDTQPGLVLLLGTRSLSQAQIFKLGNLKIRGDEDPYILEVSSWLSQHFPRLLVIQGLKHLMLKDPRSGESESPWQLPWHKAVPPFPIFLPWGGEPGVSSRGSRKESRRNGNCLPPPG